MQFEFDPAKSLANLAKHGIDFEQAQALWQDQDYLEIPARTQDEPRWLVLGQVDGRVWAAIVTCRGTAVRIISVRRARQEEGAHYEGT